MLKVPFMGILVHLHAKVLNQKQLYRMATSRVSSLILLLWTTTSSPHYTTSWSTNPIDISHGSLEVEWCWQKLKVPFWVN
jgi:hypothetical protein